MNLYLHILIHIVFALSAGLIVFLIWKRPGYAFFSAFFSGVDVDFDHFIDYYLALGFHWNWEHFKVGYQFLKSDKLYIFFHGWEYIIVFLIAGFIFRAKPVKSVFFALALGLAFHLSADVVIDGLSPRSYSIIFRARNNFDIEKMVSEDHYQKHMKEKKIFLND